MYWHITTLALLCVYCCCPITVWQFLASKIQIQKCARGRVRSITKPLCLCLPPHSFNNSAASACVEDSVRLRTSTSNQLKILLYSTMTKLISILAVLGALSGSVCFAFQASHNVGTLVTKSKSTTLLNMAPRFNKQSQQWVPSDPAVRVLLQLRIGALWRYVHIK